MTTPEKPDTETTTAPATEATSAQSGEGQAAAPPSAPAAAGEAGSSQPTGEAAPQGEGSQASEAKADAPEGASDEAKSDEAKADEAKADETKADEGGEGASGEGKKRRRKKKKGGEGAQAAEGAAPAAEGGRGKNDKDRGPPPPRTAFRVGEEIFGRVKEVKSHALIIDIPGKGDAIFDRSEFDAESIEHAVGDRFVAKVLGDGGRGGLVVLARKIFDDPTYEDKVKEEVEKAFNEKAVVRGLVTGAIKGGLEVYVKGLRAFAPASHVDLRPGSDLSHQVGQEFLFLVEQYAKKGRDVVLSRKAFLEEESKKQREGSLAKLKPGSTVKGVVRTVVEWGVFVAIPEADNIEGLVHASELSHDQRARTRDIVKVGDTIEVKITKIDDKGKLWLSKKASEPDPWEQLRSKFAPGTRHKGKVTKTLPFGAFVELEPGLEGLIHLSDLSFKRIEAPEEVVKEGQEIDVVVSSMDNATRKIGLHPAIAGAENETRQRVAPHKIIKVAIMTHEPAGLVVRILGATGRNARGFIPAGQTGTPRGTDLRKQFPANSQHEVKVIEVDPKRGEAKLSIKAVREDSEKAAYSEYRQSVAKEAKFGTLADLLKKSQQGSLERPHHRPERPDKRRARVEAGGSLVATQPRLGGHLPGVNVEIEQRLDVIGQEANRGHDHVPPPLRGQRGEGRLEVGAQPLAPVEALALEGHAAGVAREARRHQRRHRLELLLVRVTHRDHPERQAVRRQHQLDAVALPFREARERLVDHARERVDQRRGVAPARGLDQRRSPRHGGGRLARGVVINVHALRRQRQRNQAGDPRVARLGDGLRERRVGQAHPDEDRQPQLVAQPPRHLARRAQQGRAADELVAVARLVEQHLGDRATAPDSGKKCGEIVEILDRSVGREQDTELIIHKRL